MARSVSVEKSLQTGTVSETVVSAVAEETDSDPLSLEPLYTVVDPDALDAFFEHDRTGLDRSPSRVAFTYCGCDVVVTADGDVRVSESDQDDTSQDEWR